MNLKNYEFLKQWRELDIMRDKYTIYSIMYDNYSFLRESMLKAVELKYSQWYYRYNNFNYYFIPLLKEKFTKDIIQDIVCRSYLLKEIDEDNLRFALC